MTQRNIGELYLNKNLKERFIIKRLLVEKYPLSREHLFLNYIEDMIILNDSRYKNYLFYFYKNNNGFFNNIFQYDLETNKLYCSLDLFNEFYIEHTDDGLTDVKNFIVNMAKKHLNLEPALIYKNLPYVVHINVDFKVIREEKPDTE